MTWLAESIIEETLYAVDVVYINRKTAKWWNQRRRSDDTVTFCGWYWIREQEEAGPFKTRSAALRDAYYIHVLDREPPNVGHALDRNRRNKERVAA